MKQPIFLEPVFQERIWGGTALKSKFGYHIPSDNTGECWAISGHANGESIVNSGPFLGKKISELWRNNHEIFGNYPSSSFPLLVKILDAKADLSIQVHPDDEYAGTGKDECWYVLDCKENAEIVLGHNAKSKEELKHQIEKGKWDSLLIRLPIKKGDFIFIPSGTIPAICEGTLLLETQQSSDITYRIYDYDRKNIDGNTRELHLNQALQVITVPYVRYETQPIIEKKGSNNFTKLLDSKHFSVRKWEIREKAELVQDQLFMLVSIIYGQGVLDINGIEFKLKKGDHFILPATVTKYTVGGSFEAIVSHP